MLCILSCVCISVLLNELFLLFLINLAFGLMALAIKVGCAEGSFTYLHIYMNVLFLSLNTI